MLHELISALSAAARVEGTSYPDDHPAYQTNDRNQSGLRSCCTHRFDHIVQTDIPSFDIPHSDRYLVQETPSTWTTTDASPLVSHPARSAPPHLSLNTTTALRAHHHHHNNSSTRAPQLLTAMGNLCSSSSDKPSGDNFSSPGRVLGAPAQSSSSSAPVPRDRIAASNTTSPGRTLGGGSAGAGGTYGGTAQGQGQGDARSAAARAAEVRYVKFSSCLRVSVIMWSWAVGEGFLQLSLVTVCICVVDDLLLVSRSDIPLLLYPC